MSVNLHLGDCLDVMRTLPDASVDSVVVDPPYGLKFMGKRWDHGVPGVEVWRECLRLLKPGGHMLAFGGTRTSHRLVCAIEDAGFEIRDTLAWIYGSGFPKSLDVSKAIDKAAGKTREVLGGGPFAKRRLRSTAETNIEGAEYGFGPGHTITAPATEAARQWQGFGTALKPAMEPITLARKPLDGTVAANVLEYGTGGLNIDGCRVGNDEWHRSSPPPEANRPPADGLYAQDEWTRNWVANKGPTQSKVPGRWPANVIHDGSAEVLAEFPVDANKQRRPRSFRRTKATTGWSGGSQPMDHSGTDRGDSGSAARFFYCAKASRRDRNEGLEGMPERAPSRYGVMLGTPEHGAKHDTPESNTHPTVKPVMLMRYLCRLITPPSGVILDPFMGSGSTGKGAILEGFSFIGIERDPDYHAIARRRLRQAERAGKPLSA